jgi:hypothetical protein
MEKIQKHLFIPDVQAKDGVPLDHLSHIGQYIVEKKPDVIVCIGDFADMPSLSSYDKGTKSFEGRRYKKDIAAARRAMDMLLTPIKEYNAHQKVLKQKQYRPRMVMTLGNHEQRIERAVNNSAELDGVIGYHDLPYEEWEVYDYLKPVIIEGVCYTHYMANPMNGKPYGGQVATILKNVGHSFVVGHKQTLDVATRFTIDGKQQWGIVAGACYQHDEDYKGYQGNDHWRGIIMLHRVIQGSFDPCFISLDYLRDKYTGV